MNDQANQLRKATRKRSAVKARYPKFTPELKLRFLGYLRQGYSVTKACEQIAVTPRAAYAHRDSVPEFADQWDDAIEEGADFLEDVALDRAVNGVKRTVYQGGIKVGTEVVHNENLLMFMLKGRRPEKYRERMDLTSGGSSLVQSFAKALVELPNYNAPKQKPTKTG